MEKEKFWSVQVGKHGGCSVGLKGITHFCFLSELLTIALSRSEAGPRAYRVGKEFALFTKAEAGP